MRVSVSILTNGARRNYLESCIYSFLDNCHYRPLTIGIFDNGSSDSTVEYLRESFPKGYGIEWVMERSDVDLGCAEGTNRSIDLVADGSEYHIHLESDFIHMPEVQTGIDKYWLHRALEFLDDGDCDYLYLRRMENEEDIRLHWWAQWMPRISKTVGEYQKCDGFWWSNNPTLFRTSALRESGTLPLDTRLDGKKGTDGWSQPELQASKPPNAWIHKWGMFSHESISPKYSIKKYGCGLFDELGTSSCKYGLYINRDSDFCKSCDLRKGISDMAEHNFRFMSGVGVKN
jgi:hypothetical protein